jgi:uncharacterized cupredoxin-like copper-binding protein
METAMTKRCVNSFSKVLMIGMIVLLPGGVFPSMARAHEHDGSFAAGEPGDPKKAARIVNITMREAEGKMLYAPDRVEVRRGEQIRFVVKNDGFLAHEFVLASKEDNLKHAELMKKYPDMEHDDPNSKTVQPHTQAEVLWRFNRPGEFEFSCLIPGHREAGMLGKVVVK